MGEIEIVFKGTRKEDCWWKLISVVHVSTPITWEAETEVSWLHVKNLGEVGGDTNKLIINYWQPDLFVDQILQQDNYVNLIIIFKLWCYGHKIYVDVGKILKLFILQNTNSVIIIINNNNGSHPNLYQHLLHFESTFSSCNFCVIFGSMPKHYCIHPSLETEQSNKYCLFRKTANWYL